jgi:F-box protein, helicase, 18
MADITPTSEQQEIVASRANTLVINAFAGTGKTTTLIDYARARPNENMYYLAFNRAVKDEAAKKFPRNVRCVTTHGLAYRQYGALYQNKLGNPKPASIAKMFKCSFAVADSAVKTLNNFLCSPDARFDPEKHLVHNGLSNHNAETAFRTAMKIWEQMQDTSNVYVRMPHDGYLKLYQLSNPKILAHAILVDEAQDTNPMVFDFISKQACRQIYVGDHNQAIYGFRGAVDALAQINFDEKLYLTSSFRFGPGVASLASLLLRDWKGEEKEIKGLGKHATQFFVNQNNPHAILARTNSGLFDAAVTALKSKKPFGYVGGYDGYRLDMILDAWKLKKHMQGILDPSILLFKSFAELEDYANTVDDKELKMLIRVIDKYSDDIPHLIDDLKKKSVVQLTGNEVTLTTAHKAKGMEFPHVVLLDDYCELKIEEDAMGQDVTPSNEDINILYVAATRAISNLKMNDKMEQWLLDLQMYDTVMKGKSIGNYVGYYQKELAKQLARNQNLHGT